MDIYKKKLLIVLFLYDFVMLVSDMEFSAMARNIYNNAKSVACWEE